MYAYMIWLKDDAAARSQKWPGFFIASPPLELTKKVNEGFENRINDYYSPSPTRINQTFNNLFGQPQISGAEREGNKYSTFVPMQAEEMQQRGCFFQRAAMFQGWRKAFAMLLCRVRFPGCPQWSVRLRVQDIGLSTWWYQFESGTDYKGSLV